MKFYKPFHPFFITQKWGIPNPIYHQFGFKRHNGLDCSSGLKTYPIYCPVEGFSVFLVRYSPSGGGHEIWLISKEPVVSGAYLKIGMFHNDKVLVQAGYQPALGELIAIGDNTGFSTGPHSHIGFYRCNKFGQDIDTNDAGRTIDPEPYLLPEKAVDKASLSTLLKSNLRYYRYRAGF